MPFITSFSSRCHLSKFAIKSPDVTSIKWYQEPDTLIVYPALNFYRHTQLIHKTTCREFRLKFALISMGNSSIYSHGNRENPFWVTSVTVLHLWQACSFHGLYSSFSGSQDRWTTCVQIDVTDKWYSKTWKKSLRAILWMSTTRMVLTMFQFRQRIFLANLLSNSYILLHNQAFSLTSNRQAFNTL